MPAASPLTAALASMVAAEADYVTKLAAVRQVLAGLRAFMGVAEQDPVVRASAPPGRRKGGATAALRATPAPASDISRALQGGPFTLADVIKKTKLSHSQVKRMVQRGLLVGIGHTLSRRYSLPGAPARQEAP